MTSSALTDEEWRAFQSIPDQGYSHRAWVDARIAERQAAAWDESAEATAEWMAGNPGPSGIGSDPPPNPYDKERA